MSTTRLPVERMPATTACFTISPEVLGSRPMTIVPDPVCVPNACAKRVRSFGVSDWPTTPRTPEMLILRVGIARIFFDRIYRIFFMINPEKILSILSSNYFRIRSRAQSSSSRAAAFSAASTMMRIIDSVFDART